MYDTIIIGAGPAGITAAIYAARKKMNFLVLTKDIGGQTLWSSDIENYTGFHNLTGMELIEKFKEHMKDYDIKINVDEPVKEIKKKKDYFEVITSSGKYDAKTIIVTAGKNPKKLNIPGEKEFEGKGVAYCATCDAPLFSDRIVAVAGGGDAATDAALQLSKYAEKTCIINVNSELAGGDKVLIEKVKADKKIEIINNASVKEILGKNSVEKIKIEQNKKEKLLDVQGVFVAIGSIPSVDFIENKVKLDKWNQIIIDKNNMTSEPGIFAAGDVTDVPDKQTAIAAGEGCKALLRAYDYLAKKK